MGTFSKRYLEAWNSKDPAPTERPGKVFPVCPEECAPTFDSCVNKYRSPASCLHFACQGFICADHAQCDASDFAIGQSVITSVFIHVVSGLLFFVYVSRLLLFWFLVLSAWHFANTSSSCWHHSNDSFRIDIALHLVLIYVALQHGRQQADRFCSFRHEPSKD
jgi:hypothetical protein